MKKLTIAIPTFNRAYDLGRSLECLLPVVNINKDCVDVIISDNASADDTMIVVQNYQKLYPGIITYYRHNENIGAHPNFFFCIDKARTEYIYLLGDDDIVLPYTLETFFTVVKENPEIGLVHFNYMSSTYNLMKTTIVRGEISLPFIKIYEKGKDFILEHLSYPSFMSTNIFRKKLWEDGKPYWIEDCPGYDWLSILLFGALNYKCAYCSIPAVIALSSPTGDSYNDRMALYLIYGQGVLFKSLDEKVAGVYSAWQNYRQSNVVGYMRCLASGSLNKSLYREKYNEIAEHIAEKKYKFFFWICVYVLPEAITRFLSKVITILLMLWKKCFFVKRR